MSLNISRYDMLHLYLKLPVRVYPQFLTTLLIFEKNGAMRVNVSFV